MVSAQKNPRKNCPGAVLSQWWARIYLWETQNLVFSVGWYFKYNQKIGASPRDCLCQQEKTSSQASHSPLPTHKPVIWLTATNRVLFEKITANKWFKPMRKWINYICLKAVLMSMLPFFLHCWFFSEHIYCMFVSFCYSRVVCTPAAQNQGDICGKETGKVVDLRGTVENITYVKIP